MNNVLLNREPPCNLQLDGWCLLQVDRRYVQHKLPLGCCLTESCTAKSIAKSFENQLRQLVTASPVPGLSRTDSKIEAGDSWL